ncbi:MAG: peptidase domain-containing ABC transporter [Saprospiraceae bacterium]|nr:peptidase domain-containing ABC transporter [Saprospiraceae bacterium]
MPTFPFYKQAETKDCGPTCLKIISKHYGRLVDIQSLRELAETTRLGSNLFGISTAAEAIGFRSLALQVNYQQLRQAQLPCILHWNHDHFVVLYKIKRDRIYISDPGHGLLHYVKDDFLQRWVSQSASEETQEGIALLLEPTPEFYDEESATAEPPDFNLAYLSRYLFKYKNLVVQLIIGLLAASILQLIFPFLTQSVVDIGIKHQDIHFIYLILFAQLALFLGKTAVEVLRRWILLHLSTRINISLVSDFFIKLMNLPIAYFDTKMTGDILQRINDHKRIERILTTSSISVLFSLVNLFIFGLVLAYYDFRIFAIFLIGSLLYFGWILLFFRKRKKLDYKQFAEISKEQSKVIEMINGMQEVKLHNAERQKRWSWEHVQARLFKVSIQNLALEQYQSVGSSFINELKNIFITIVAALLVIQGEITLGMMLAIAFIVGQLNAPIGQLINFLRELQDAKISLERLGEIHQLKVEEDPLDQKIKELPPGLDLKLKDLSFRYKGTDQLVLRNLSFRIPANKVTAIVGVSGSGKTTLMKLLLNFYNPQAGSLDYGHFDLKNISQPSWRNKVGVVMQEGYIFNDTIANNIAVGQPYVDKERLRLAVDVANIREYIERLPLSYNTPIGMEGMGLSTGQKQRLLIARAVYKDPDILFFDEATSALDANNEKAIMEKLNQFFTDKTVLIIAHRLSTVKNAHQIVVLDQGRVVELGDHRTLVAQGGYYYQLVKNQLELGN